MFYHNNMMEKSNSKPTGIDLKDSKIAPDFMIKEKILIDEKENVRAKPSEDIKNATTSSLVLKTPSF